MKLVRESLNESDWHPRAVKRKYPYFGESNRERSLTSFLSTSSTDYFFTGGFLNDSQKYDKFFNSMIGIGKDPDRHWRGDYPYQLESIGVEDIPQGTTQV